MVKYGDVTSDWTETLGVIPQGSILVTLMLNNFMNDFFYFMEGQPDLYNYADDNTLSVHAKILQTMKETLENAANIGIKWFKDTYMQANPDQFEVMLPKGIRYDVDGNGVKFEVDGVTINSDTEYVKLLGV